MFESDLPIHLQRLKVLCPRVTEEMHSMYV